jgi:hypothetical protein
MTDARDAIPEPDDSQAEIVRLRRTLATGRGPGASRAEVLRHTRGRTTVGGRPVAEQREAVARAAAAARRDPDDVLLHVVTARARLDSDVAAGRRRWAARPRRPLPRRILGFLAQSHRLRRTVTTVVGLLATRAAWRHVRGRRRDAPA